MNLPRRIFSTRRGHILVQSFNFVKTIFICFFLFVTPAKAINSCQPGEKCTFPLYMAYEPCTFNEKRFFTVHGNSWEFQPDESRWLNNDLGDFGKAAGYQWTAHKGGGGIYGGCVCDTASWVNYVLKVNGFETRATAPYADPSNMANVPREYYVTISDADGKNPVVNGVMQAGGSGDLWVKNPSETEVWVLKWELHETTVDLWVEKGGQIRSDPKPQGSSDSAPKAPEYIDDVTSDTPAANDANQSGFIPDLNFDTETEMGTFSATAKTPTSEIVFFAEIALAGVLILCSIASIFSKVFRKAMFIVIVILLIVAALAFVFLYL